MKILLLPLILFLVLPPQAIIGPQPVQGVVLIIDTIDMYVTKAWITDVERNGSMVMFSGLTMDGKRLDGSYNMATGDTVLKINGVDQYSFTAPYRMINNILIVQHSEEGLSIAILIKMS